MFVVDIAYFCRLDTIRNIYFYYRESYKHFNTHVFTVDVEIRDIYRYSFATRLTASRARGECNETKHADNSLKVEEEEKKFL